jgi:hypothetical protein
LERLPESVTFPSTAYNGLVVGIAFDADDELLAVDDEATAEDDAADEDEDALLVVGCAEDVGVACVLVDVGEGLLDVVSGGGGGAWLVLGAAFLEVVGAESPPSSPPPLLPPKFQFPERTPRSWEPKNEKRDGERSSPPEGQPGH